MKKLFLLGLSCFILSFAFVSTTTMANEGDQDPFCTGPNCQIIK